MIESTLWPEVKQHLAKSYNVLTTLDLGFYNLDLDVFELYRQLSKYKDYVFADRDRIIIVFSDTDYFPDINGTPNTLWNIHQIYNHYRISTEHTLLLHWQVGIEHTLDLLAQQFYCRPIPSVYCPYARFIIHPNAVSATDLNSHEIKHSFLCMNNVPRNHRIYTLLMMHKHGILEHGMTSLNSQVRYPNVQLSEVKDDFAPHFRTLLPPTRINDRLVLDNQQQHYYHKNYNLINQQHRHQDIDPSSVHKVQVNPLKFIQRALWHVVNDSVGDYPYAMFTEKIIHAILQKRPFVLLGSRGSLALLKSLGFKTFNSWIDESYDLESTFANRSERAVQQLIPFTKLSQHQLQQVCHEMQPILDYNYEHYVKGFGERNLAMLLESKL